MATKRRAIWWVIGALLLAGFAGLVAMAAYAPPPRLARDEIGDRVRERDRGDGRSRPGSGGNTATDKLPPEGVTPGPGGPRDAPVALDAAIERAVLNPDGSVTASGYLICTPGQATHVGWDIWNVRSSRPDGMVRTGADRLYYECTGERQEWELTGEEILFGGIEPGPHPYTVKTSVGTRSRNDHRDYFQGTIVVQG